jgi:peptidoglycan/LPS O-acetylase OafA/YrhL
MLNRKSPGATISDRRADMSLRPALDPHIPALDGIRGLAVLMVLVFHFIGCVPATNGFERFIVRVTSYGAGGVELFFVLSGFLITGILYDTCRKPHYFRNFYARRALRIFPIYYGVLFLIFFVAPMIPLLRGSTLDYLVDRQAWAWLYGVNVYIAQQGDWSFSYIEHFWSLAVEEHFYLVWPLAVFLAPRPRALIALSLGIAACAMLARPVGLLLGLSWTTTYVLTPFRLDGLALGAFIAVMARQPSGMDRLARALPQVIAVAAGLLAATYVFKGLASSQIALLADSIRLTSIQVLLACLLVGVLVAPEQSISKRLFCSRWMVFLGTYSYGLYVYHHFIFYYMNTNHTELELAQWVGSHGLAVALQAAAGMAASLAIAYVSYELFEKRILKLKGFFGTKNARAAMLVH